jgi:hypothetical protein
MQRAPALKVKRAVTQRLLTTLTFVAAMAAVLGCAPDSTRQAVAAIPLGSAWQLPDGQNTISGRASLVSRSGYVRTCEGNAVYLIPVTPASTALMVRLFGQASGGYASRFEFQQQPESLLKSGRQVDCRQDFTFERVPDGSYYAITDVTWLLRLVQEGAALGTLVQVDGGKAIELDLRHAY